MTEPGISVEGPPVIHLGFRIHITLPAWYLFRDVNFQNQAGLGETPCAYQMRACKFVHVAIGLNCQFEKAGVEVVASYLEAVDRCIDSGRLSPYL